MKCRELRERDWDAADMVLAKYPHLRGEDPDRARYALAQLHRVMGHSRFLLRFRFRKPRTGYERLDVEHFDGRISLDELMKRYREHARRPVDDEMLKMQSRHVERCLTNYSRMLTLIGPLDDEVACWIDESLDAEIATLLKRARHPGHFPPEEMQSVDDHLNECRARRGFGAATLGHFTSPNALRLAHAVMRAAHQLWKQSAMKCRRVRSAIGSPVTAFYAKSSVPLLPLPNDILVLVEHDFALARMELRERQRTESPTVLRPAKVEIHAERVDMDTVALNPARSPDQDAPPLLKVDRWTDLAIGIDEHRNYWAVAPAPALGQSFPKSKAVNLPLGGKKWPVVLEALAQSLDGHRVERSLLLKLLDILPPSSSVEREARARPGAIENSHCAQLESVKSASLASLNQTLAELRPQLGKLVQGPTGHRGCCLRTEDDLVNSRFYVAYLLPDEAGRLRFGNSPGC